MTGHCMECGDSLVVASMVASNGVTHFGLWCPSCGHTWRAIKKADVANYVGDGDVVQRDEQVRQDYNKRLSEERAAEWQANKAQRDQEYHSYLNTTEWRRIREAVLIRDGYLCQGCLRARANDVHHRTYNHCRNELMFELVSLCRACHDRIHGIHEEAS